MQVFNAVLTLAVVLGTDGGGQGVDDTVQVKGHYLEWRMAPDQGGAIEHLGLVGAQDNLAVGEGLLLEGFGVDSPYVPNRRLNERMETLDSSNGPPTLRYSYDCDGPNIRGLRVLRTVTMDPGESSIRVKWTVEHKGTEEQWVAPWVRNETAPGGEVDEGDRIDVPTLDGVVEVDRNTYYPASRNWIAVTDPVERQTVYAVFDANTTHSFLAFENVSENVSGFQTAYAPLLIAPGDRWETVYRINVVRGLEHIDFATDELAMQLDYEQGKLFLLFTSVKPLPRTIIETMVLGPGDAVWRLPAKQFALAPDKLVRCTYDWEAPAAGAYGIQARLSSGGKLFKLGQDTSSPHGEIDTQFVVGNPERAAMAPWTYAPYLRDRGARTLERPVAMVNGTALWFESSLDKVFREDRPKPRGSFDPIWNLTLAANEAESFQVVLRPPEGAALHDVVVRPHDLVNTRMGATIPADCIAVHNVSYYPVRVPTHFESFTGEVPDALPAHIPFTAWGGACTPIWVTVYAPRGTAAGVYTGLLELRSPDLDPVDLFIEAKVYGFELPVTPALKTDFGFGADEAVSWCTRLGYSGSEEDLIDAYVSDALQHRVTLREGAQLPAETADYAESLAEYRPRAAELRKRGATTFAVPPTLLDVPEQLAMANGFVEENGLEGRAFCPIAEEPLPPAWPRLFERIQAWKEAAPSIPVMVTAKGIQPFLSDAVEIWTVHSQLMDTVNGGPVLERIASGGEAWWYVDYVPPRPYGNFCIEFAPIEHRILFWQSWILGMRGFHYWCVNCSEPGQNPWQDQLDSVPANGDGFLVYPGAAGPVSSIRWEVIRDGIEDYDYLALLRDRLGRLGRDEADSERAARVRKVLDLSALLPDLISFSRNPKDLSRKRDEIARAIVDLE